MRSATRTALFVALLVGASSASQARGPSSYEQLATVPDTTTAQQEEIHRIESERHSAYADLFTKQRAERERIDAQTAQKLRKALGDDGYRKYAEWKMAHAGAHGRRHAQGQRGHHPRAGMRGGPGTRGPGPSGGPELPPDGERDGDGEPNS